MTREEAIDFGEMFLEVNIDSKNSSTYKFIDKAVKLFKQEPCEDLVSRDAVEDAIASAVVNGESLGYSVACDILSDLPPVTLKPKIVYCDKCNYTWDYTTDKEGSLASNYCPNCGAKMEGLEE